MKVAKSAGKHSVKSVMKQAICYVLFSTLCVSCGFSDSTDDEEDDPTSSVTGQGQQSQASSLTQTFPASLALSVFPEEDSTAATLLLQGEVDDPNAGKTTREKVDETKKRLAGTAEKCLNMDVFRSRNSGPDLTCYEFDSDMNPARYPAPADNPDAPTQVDTGTLDGTAGAGDSEACMVAFARHEVNEAVSTVDKALELISGVLCQAKKDGTVAVLPEVDEYIDLSASLKTASAGKMGITEAKLSRLADIDGAAVYRNDIIITDPEGREMEVHLIHSPGIGGNSNGTLWMKRPPRVDSNAPANDPNNSSNKNHVLSINYSRSTTDAGDENMKFQVRRAAIVNTIEPFDSNGLVNYAGLPDEAQNSEIHAIQFLAFDMNPTTNAGDLSYWMNPGGNYNESARGFLFNISADAEGTLSGCGISGATDQVSIRKSLAEPDTATLEPVQFWHPRGSQNIHPDEDPRYSHANTGNKITEQCFKQDSEGTYKIDADTTAHARGYEVIETSASTVQPPRPPRDHIKGKFVE